MNGASKRVEQTRATGWQQAVLLLRLSMAGMQVHQGQHAAAKNIIQESKNEIESMQDPLPELQAAFYLASCDSLKANRQFSQYYKNALTYLAYVDLKTMPNEDKTMFAVDLVLAALLGEDTYTFGELLRHPLVEGLRQGPHQWLHALLESVDGGDLVGFEAVTNRHADYFNAQPLLVENKPKIEQKVALLALVNRIIAASAVNSEFTFDSLAKSSKVPLARIEILVMKAISLHLISGHMDEVKQTLTVTWVMPKQLTDKEVKQRGESVETWSKHIYNVLLNMENEVPELLLEA